MIYQETTQCKQFVCITSYFETYHFVLWILKKRKRKEETKRNQERNTEFVVVTVTLFSQTTFFSVSVYGYNA